MALFPRWVIIAGFKDKAEVLATPFRFFPKKWMVQNYTDILGDSAFIQSVLVTFGARYYLRAELGRQRYGGIRLRQARISVQDVSVGLRHHHHVHSRHGDPADLFYRGE